MLFIHHYIEFREI